MPQAVSKQADTTVGTEIILTTESSSKFHAACRRVTQQQLKVGYILLHNPHSRVHIFTQLQSRAPTLTQLTQHSRAHAFQTLTVGHILRLSL